MTDRVLANKKIIPVWDTEIIKIDGGKRIETLTVKKSTGEVSELKVRGLFVAIGHTPNTKFVQDLVQLDENGYIETTKKMQTSSRGIWAAGDVQDPHYRQAVTAAGSGCIAALEIERWLSHHPPS